MRRPLTILNVAYPLALVSFDATGGAEQVVAQLDAALVAGGHRSIVVASDGSDVQGTLVATPRVSGVLDDAAVTRARAAHRAAMSAALATEPVDVVHLHGIDFLEYLPPAGVPVLATLHLPLPWYPPGVFTLSRPDTYLQCVSISQARSGPGGGAWLEPIPNGIPVDRLRGTRPCPRGDHLLCLGRICPEKGYDQALDAARQAGVPLVLAGEVYDYPAHREYFDQEIRPRLDHQRRFVGPVGFAAKRDLLAGARAVLVPSRVAETSSLVTMEALACGTPAIVSSAGALPEVIEPGRTGLVADGVDALVAAIREVDRLRPQDCRAAARRRFSLRRTTAQYLERYHQLAERRTQPPAVVPETTHHAA